MKVLLIGGPQHETVRTVDAKWIPHGMFFKDSDGRDVLYRARLLNMPWIFDRIQVQFYGTDESMNAIRPKLVEELLRKHKLYPFDAQSRTQRPHKPQPHVYTV